MLYISMVLPVFLMGLDVIVHCQNNSDISKEFVTDETRTVSNPIPIASVITNKDQTKPIFSQQQSDNVGIVHETVTTDNLSNKSIDALNLKEEDTHYNSAPDVNLTHVEEVVSIPEKHVQQTDNVTENSQQRKGSENETVQSQLATTRNVSEVGEIINDRRVEINIEKLNMSDNDKSENPIKVQLENTTKASKLGNEIVVKNDSKEISHKEGLSAESEVSTGELNKPIEETKREKLAKIQSTTTTKIGKPLNETEKITKYSQDIPHKEVKPVESDASLTSKSSEMNKQTEGAKRKNITKENSKKNYKLGNETHKIKNESSTIPSKKSLAVRSGVPDEFNELTENNEDNTAGNTKPYVPMESPERIAEILREANILLQNYYGQTNMANANVEGQRNYANQISFEPDQLSKKNNLNDYALVQDQKNDLSVNNAIVQDEPNVENMSNVNSLPIDVATFDTTNGGYAPIKMQLNTADFNNTNIGTFEDQIVDKNVTNVPSEDLSQNPNTIKTVNTPVQGPPSTENVKPVTNIRYVNIGPSSANSVQIQGNTSNMENTNITTPDSIQPETVNTTDHSVDNRNLTEIELHKPTLDEQIHDQIALLGALIDRQHSAWLERLVENKTTLAEPIMYVKFYGIVFDMIKNVLPQLQKLANLSKDRDESAYKVNAHFKPDHFELQVRQVIPEKRPTFRMISKYSKKLSALASGIINLILSAL